MSDEGFSEETIKRDLEWMAAEGFANKVGDDAFSLTDEGRASAEESMGGPLVIGLADCLHDVLKKHGTLFGPLPEEFVNCAPLYFSVLRIAQLLEFYGVAEKVRDRLIAEGFGKDGKP